ncbi:hypothetical protein DFJ69_4696 [Thermomonospora umbrina]|uniref:Uncharacterized protein n=2 Tax=Thermomonospora umbrina TaxID=111806 RepID=A0A3D9ST98_9ACTN|nr:hypothetical protein DFJ69_4696 [Thermomonospora umbrina]
MPGRTGGPSGGPADGDPERTRVDDAPVAGPTAPQPLPASPPPGPAKVTAPQALPSSPPAQPAAPEAARPDDAGVTAPQPLPEQPVPQQAQARPAAEPPADGVTQTLPAPGPVPQGPAGHAPVPPAPHHPAPPQPVPVPPVPPQPGAAPFPQPVTGTLGRRPAGWHRLHYPIGIFLVAYGITTLLFSVLGWNAHRDEIGEYLGEGVASPALIAVKVVQGLLVLVALAGLIRRRDVWFLPALAGWAAGFAVFCVLVGAEGRLGDLAEHAAFLVVFAALLCLSYALGVKARVASARPPEDDPGPSQGPGQLSRTQEIALAALNRWQQPAVFPQGPPQGPPAPGQTPQQPYGAVPQGPPQPPYGGAPGPR